MFIRPKVIGIVNKHAGIRAVAQNVWERAIMKKVNLEWVLHKRKNRTKERDSLMVLWLRICLVMQRTQFQSLPQELKILRAAGQVNSHTTTTEPTSGNERARMMQRRLDTPKLCMPQPRPTGK